ncbi:MAG: sugar ABC transporter substrate-binding protein [Eubacteriales bacterium]|nr:sugar ABC transporter substrate-binding protein [Eubacteriales bacterium]
MKQKLALVLALVMVFAFVTIGTAETAKPYAGVTIRVGTEEGGLYSLWYKEHVKEFEDATGMTVIIEEVPELTNTFTLEAMSQSGYYDLFNMDGPVIPEFASNGWIIPLDEYIEDGYLDDFYASAIDSCKFDGSLYAIPYLVHGPVLYYRTDLFEKAGLTEAPTTNEQIREYAKKLNDPANNICGFIVEGKQSGEAVSQLHDKIYQFGGDVLDAEYNVKINSQSVADMFSWIMAMQWEDKSLPEAGINYNNGDVQNLFLQGQAAMVCNWPYMWSMTKDPSTSAVVGNVAVAPQPVTNALWSWSYAISSDSKNKEAAYEFLKWTVDPTNLGTLGAEFCNPVTRVSSVDVALSQLTDEADISTFKALTQMLAQGKAPVLTTNYSEIRTRIGEALNKIVSQSVTDIQAELDACAADIEALVKDAAK